MKNILAAVLCLLIGFHAIGQSKKERKKYKIKSTTEWETVTEGTESKTYKSLYEEFDREGRLTVHIEYATDGSITQKETAVYDKYGNKTEETEFDKEKGKNVKRTYKYNALNDKVEEVEFNGSGVIQKKTTFTYDAAGNKTSETSFDASGKQIKKSTYTYNSKGLKTAKQTVGKSTPTDPSKKWDYVYY